MPADMHAPDGASVPNNGTPVEQDGDGTISLVQLASALLRHRVLVIAMPVITVSLAILSMALSGALTRHTYTATSAFAPQGRTAPAATGLAAQIALGAAGGGDLAQSPAFYIDLVRTRPLLREVVMSKFATEPGQPPSRTLAEILLDGKPATRAGIEAAINALSGATGVSHNPRTSVVTLSVTMPTPVLARAVNAKFLELVNKFNLERRQTQAASERRFAERRLEEVRAELRDAEDRLQSFLERNREFRSDPSLGFAHDRLSRQVALRQQIVATLSNSYETARIDQARDTPVITIVAQPEEPVFPNPRGRVRSVLLAAIVGLVAGILLALWRDYTQFARRRNAREYETFDELRAEVFSNLRRFGRRSRQAASGS